MNFALAPEIAMLVESIDRYLADRYPLKAREGTSREHWQALAELGVTAALFPEQDGGLAGSGHDIAAVFGALGRGLVTEPFLGALMAGRLLAAAGEHDLLGQVIAGEVVAVLGHEEADSHYVLDAIETRGERLGDAWALTGTKVVVPGLAAADFILVTAQAPEGLSLFLLEPNGSGAMIQDYALIDGGCGGDLVLDRAPARLLGTAGQALPLIEAATAAGLTAISAEAVAVMDVLLAQTLEYLRTRKQFGVPIGSFQALKHRMANLALEIEQARSAAYNAAAALDAQRVTRERAASAAKFTIGRVGTLASEEAIQLHGGIGMTWELPLSHYAKRLSMIGQELGDEDHHLERYVALGA
jgi:alkylation response protein AidB-like acyl-CoA dehydrogenase